MFLFCPWGENTVMEKFWLCCLCCHPPQVVEMWVSLWTCGPRDKLVSAESRKGEQMPNIHARPLGFASGRASSGACLEKWPGRTNFRFPQEQFNVYPRPRPVRQDECWFGRLLHCSARCSRCVTVIDHTDVQEWRRRQLMFPSLNLPKRGNELLAGLLMIYRTILVRLGNSCSLMQLFFQQSSRRPYLQIRIQ